jgi:uncharacterized protein YndB with AHSA1/START domain
MLLVVERRLPAPPDLAWPYLTEPDAMNQWSGARIVGVSPGDGGGFDGVGALRRVEVPAYGRTMVLDEVIADAEPPRRLEYRVYQGFGVSRHRGVMRLRPDGANGSRLRWEVEARLYPTASELFARRFLERELGRSLDVLVSRMRSGELVTPGRTVGAPPVPAPGPTRLRPDLGPLFADAEACVREQQAIADRLATTDDPKRWFVRVYQFVSELQIAACRKGAFVHPDWVLRIVPRFHAYYVENLRRWTGEAAGACEDHWRSSFRAMELAHRWRRRALDAVLYGVAKGMQAHIEEDLPRTLAEVHHRHYRSVFGYARFRADYLAMAEVFRGAGERLMAEIPRAWWPVQARLLDRALPYEVKVALQRRTFYDLPRERLRAFERGRRLSAMLAEVGGADPDPSVTPA